MQGNLLDIDYKFLLLLSHNHKLLLNPMILRMGMINHCHLDGILRLYVDGVLVSTAGPNTEAIHTHANRPTVRIGSEPIDGLDSFTGSLDSVAPCLPAHHQHIAARCHRHLHPMCQLHGAAYHRLQDHPEHQMLLLMRCVEKTLLYRQEELKVRFR